MTIFSLLSVLGGLAIFLYGMALMGEGLEKSSGNQLKSVLENLTSNRLKGVLLGAAVTAIIQSSSATTVMVVGFVNSGVMKLSQSIGIIMGSNIGTTVTGWLLSLVGLESDNVVLQLFKTSNLALITAIVGILLYMVTRDSRKKDIGTIFLGFAILITGMNMMSAAVEPLSEMQEFRDIMLLFANPILGVVVGALLTAIIQSSSASVGMLQALSTTGSVTFGMALPIILGQNIGTCATAMLSSIGANKNARRAAIVHLCFNIIGTILFLVVFYSVNAMIKFTFVEDSISPVGIAIVHTIFNVVATFVMLPFTKQLEKLAYFLIKEEETPDEVQLLDERLLATPAIAIGECKKVANQMAELAKDTLFLSMDLLVSYSEAGAKTILENEELIDDYEDKLGSYLVKVSQKHLGTVDSHEVSQLLHSIGDFERIADHACNLLTTAEEIHTKRIIFSENARHELEVASAAIREIIENTTDVFVHDDVVKAKNIEPLEQVIDNIKRELKTRHIERLKNNECTMEMGFIFTDIVTNYERVADHCSNVAVCLIQVAEDSFKTHEYLNYVKSHGENLFDELYRDYMKKYNI